MEIYQQFKDFDGTLSEKRLMPYPGGCENTCSGKEIQEKCFTDSYGRKCIYKCYGYLYNRCQGTLGLIKYYLVK